MAQEYSDIIVFKQFLIFVSPLEHLFDTKVAIQKMFSKLYPRESSINIKRLRDCKNCDLDDEYLAGCVFANGDSLMAYCELRAVSVETCDEPLQPDLEAVRHPIPLRDCHIITPISTIDDQIREASEIVFDAIPPSKVVRLSPEIPSEHAAACSIALDCSSRHKVTSVEKSARGENRPVTAVASGADRSATESVTSGSSSGYETATDSESEEQKVVSGTVVGQGCQSDALHHTSSEYETETESESESGHSETPASKICSNTAPDGAEPIRDASVSSSSEYETGTEYESEDEDAGRMVATASQLEQKLEHTADASTQPIGRSGDEGPTSGDSSSEDSHFRPAPLTEPLDQVQVATTPTTNLGGPVRKYGSHLFASLKPVAK